jgi:hypothetical protein
MGASPGDEEEDKLQDSDDEDPSDGGAAPAEGPGPYVALGNRRRMTSSDPRQAQGIMETGRHSSPARNQPTEMRRDRRRRTTRGLFCGALLSGHRCAQGVEGGDERLLKIDESGTVQRSGIGKHIEAPRLYNSRRVKRFLFSLATAFGPLPCGDDRSMTKRQNIPLQGRDPTHSAGWGGYQVSMTGVPSHLLAHKSVFNGNLTLDDPICGQSCRTHLSVGLLRQPVGLNPREISPLDRVVGPTCRRPDWDVFLSCSCS